MDPMVEKKSGLSKRHALLLLALAITIFVLSFTLEPIKITGL